MIDTTRIPRTGIALADATPEQARTWHHFTTPQGFRWLLAPIAGADGDDDDDDPAAGDPAGTGDPAGSGGTGDPPAPTGTGSGGGTGGSSDDDDDDDDDDEPLTPAQARALREENARLQREQNETAKRARKAEREARKAREKQQQDDGEFRSLYEQAQSELAATKTSVKRSALKSSIKSLAAGANFRNPDVAVNLLMPTLNLDDMVDDDEFEVDEGAVEKAVQQLAKTDPYLVRTQKPQKEALNGNGSRDRKDKNTRREQDQDPASPANQDDPTQWNPAATMTRAYASNSGAGGGSGG